MTLLLSCFPVNYTIPVKNSFRLVLLPGLKKTDDSDTMSLLAKRLEMKNKEDECL